MKLLILDDNQIMLSVISGIVSRLGRHEIVTLLDPMEALRACSQQTFDMVVADYMMPGLDGIRFISTIRKLPAYRDIPIVMVTSADEKATCIEALEAGATDFVAKPIDPAELRARLQNLLALRQAQVDLGNRAEWLAREVEKATRQLKEQERELIVRLARAIECRDNETGDHVARMADLCRIVARGLGLDAETCATIHLAATLHDVGKIGVPDAILSKPGKLTDDERRQMCEHVSIGEAILSGGSSRLMDMAAAIAATHHEHWDGRGYPHGLRGPEIPIEGRIAAVADVFEALCADRVYRPAWPVEQARAYITEHSGKQFDPACVEAFERCWDEISACIDPPARRTTH
jgi:putative two-component system response regulator